MDYRIVKVGVSPKQISKLRNGRKVRIRPPMEGEGVCMVVRPENYSMITRTFAKSKGMDVALTPDEIVANQETAPTMEGEGIFGKKFDKLLKKAGIKKIAYKVGDVVKPLVKETIDRGLEMGGMYFGLPPGSTAPLSALAGDYLDRPGDYQGKRKGKKESVGKMASRIARDAVLGEVNSRLGTSMGNLDRANVEDALLGQFQNMVAQRQAQLAQQQAPSSFDRFQTMGESGLRQGDGLYLGVKSGRGMMSDIEKMSKRVGRKVARPFSRTGGAVGLNGGMVRSLPPALQSQPFSANFQFSSTLPPAYQKYSRGSGLYM
jgi:hypothetical protein